MARPIVFVAACLALAACGAGSKEKAPRAAPLVTPAVAVSRAFVDRIEAVGTARANEQVTVAAPVTERITRINFQDGGYVARGQIIAELARGQENAQLAEAQAQATQAQQQLQRLQSLKTRGFATNASVDAQVAAAQAARAQAAQATATIGDRVIRAPFGGYASLRTVSPGAVVTAGTEIAQISDISRIKLDFPVPETMLRSIREGQAIEAHAAAFGDERFEGRIATIDPVIDPATRAVTVRAILPNPDRRLKPGMLLRVAIKASPRVGVAVPELAVVGEGDERYVYRLGPDRVARRMAVKTGVRDGGMIEVTDGLRPGQRVVGEGIVKVSDGTQVRLAGDAPAKAGAGGAREAGKAKGG